MRQFTSSTRVFAVVAIIFAAQPQVCAQECNPPSCASGPYRGTGALAKPLTDLYARDLLTQYGPAADVPIRFENKEGTSLTITDARVVLVNQPSGEGFVAKAIIILTNTTGQRITGFSLHFTNNGKEQPYEPIPVFSQIEPFGSLTYAKLQEDDLSYWVGDPEKLIVKIGIVEVEEQDETKDAKHVDRTPILIAGPPTIITDVDNPDTKYVTVKVLVSVFGLAKKVIIEEADFSDKVREQVLQAANKCRFRPAVRDGQPVAYWGDVTMEIISRQRLSSFIAS